MEPLTKTGTSRLALAPLLLLLVASAGVVALEPGAGAAGLGASTEEARELARVVRRGWDKAGGGGEESVVDLSREADRGAIGARGRGRGERRLLSSECLLS